jgi:hypothetical protein
MTEPTKSGPWIEAGIEAAKLVVWHPVKQAAVSASTRVEATQTRLDEKTTRRGAFT